MKPYVKTLITLAGLLVAYHVAVEAAASMGYYAAPLATRSCL